MKKLRFSLKRADFEAAQLFHSIFLQTVTFPHRNDCVCAILSLKVSIRAAVISNRFFSMLPRFFKD
jgi:hypothetical protein